MWVRRSGGQGAGWGQVEPEDVPGSFLEKRGHTGLLEGLAGVYRDFPKSQRWDSGSGVQKVLHTEKGPQGKIQKHRQA